LYYLVVVLPIAMTNQGVSVQVRDSSGRVLERLIDPPTAWKCAGSVSEESVPLLASVDIYGDTEFRDGDCEKLAEEIRQIRSAATGEDARFLVQVEQAARKVAADPKLRLGFFGA
jgi:hypothetical protein